MRLLLGGGTVGCFASDNRGPRLLIAGDPALFSTPEELLQLIVGDLGIEVPELAVGGGVTQAEMRDPLWKRDGEALEILFQQAGAAHRVQDGCKFRQLFLHRSQR